MNGTAHHYGNQTSLNRMNIGLTKNSTRTKRAGCTNSGYIFAEIVQRFTEITFPLCVLLTKLAAILERNLNASFSVTITQVLERWPRYKPPGK